MKKIFTLFLAGIVSLTCSAKVITVSNHTNSPGQYTNLQTAIDSASAGDSIYVHGSNTSYGNVKIKKLLYLFGTGHNPNKANTLVSEIGNIQLDSTVNVTGASGSKIIGFKLNRITGYAASGGTKNILVSRNYFITTGSKISVTGSGWIIQNNIILASYVDLNSSSNVIIRNNVFSGSYITSSDKSSVLISNNVFIGNSYALSIVSNAIIANNIFKGATPKGPNINGNVFSNNLTYQTSYDTIPFGTNTGSGNMVAQNPLFVNVPANAFSYSYDFSLQAASPGKNAGTDGTDVGIFGGVMPFTDMTGSPAIPQVKSVSILNPVIPVGDSLKVVIKANKQN